MLNGKLIWPWLRNEIKLNWSLFNYWTETEVGPKCFFQFKIHRHGNSKTSWHFISFRNKLFQIFPQIFNLQQKATRGVGWSQRNSFEFQMSFSFKSLKWRWRLVWKVAAGVAGLHAGVHPLPGLGFPNGVLHPNGVPAAAAPVKNVVINIDQ